MRKVHQVTSTSPLQQGRDSSATRYARLKAACREVLSTERQAVVVIHGIGQQRPMDTLRPFVDAVLGTTVQAPVKGGGPLYWSKPDDLSATFELRRLQGRDHHPSTDWYELYWQHLVPTATWSRIAAWWALLLRRRTRDVPPALRGIWSASWALTIGVALMLAWSIWIWTFADGDAAAPSVKLPLGLAALLAIVEGLILNYVGDAAIYLSPSPGNISARQAVREAGVNLLQKLHARTVDGRPAYDRIILVGHSLGSVIGYDILTHAWPRFNEVHGRAPDPFHSELDAAQKAASALKQAGAASDAGDTMVTEQRRKRWREASRGLWIEQRANRFDWRVSDFVTLGSPLTHAQLLLACSRAEFYRKRAERELPLCPPELENDRTFSFPKHYETEAGRKRTVMALHHGACFAVTRWTNLYAPTRWLVKGDAIGGPLAGGLGSGIEDIPVRTSTRQGWLSHTAYWQCGPRDLQDPGSSINVLARALDLRRSSFQVERIIQETPTGEDDSACGSGVAAAASGVQTSAEET